MTVERARRPQRTPMIISGFFSPSARLMIENNKTKCFAFFSWKKKNLFLLPRRLKEKKMKKKRFRGGNEKKNDQLWVSLFAYYITTFALGRFGHRFESSTSVIILDDSVSICLYWPSRDTFSGPVLAYFLMKSISVGSSITLNSKDVPHAASANGRSAESARWGVMMCRYRQLFTSFLSCSTSPTLAHGW